MRTRRMTRTDVDRASSRTARAAPWIAAAIAVALLGTRLVLILLNFDEHLDRGTSAGLIPEIVDQITSLAMILVALVITRKEPANAFGWVLVVVVLGFSLFDIGLGLALLGDPSEGGWALVAAWSTNWTWTASALGVPFVLLLFPTGRPPTPRWRIAVWIAGANAASIALLTMVYPGPLDEFRGVANPLGWSVLPEADGEGLGLIAPFFVVHVLAILAGLVSLVVRYRRATSVERRQIGWVVYGCVVFVASLLAGMALPGVLGLPLDVLGGVVLGTTIVVAMLRYRLYEIDRIVNRTVTYAVVSAILAALYLSVAVLPSLLLDLESDLLVAAATLAAAAGFGPVRRSTQAVVDRVFNRSRYDAVQEVERFGSRARETTDLDGLARELAASVAGTVQPAHVTLWLRQHGPLP